MEMVCKTCGEKADCVGWWFPEQCPADNPSNADEFFCNEHCDHDMCATVEERKRTGYFEPGGGYQAK